MPITYHIAGAYAHGGHYEAYSDADVVSILAYGVPILGGKTLMMCYQSTGTITMAARTYTTPLTIKSLNASSGFNAVVFSGSVNNIEWVDCNFKHQPWPRSANSLVRASSGVSTGQNFTRCLFFHGYGAGHTPVDPTIYYPEQDPVTGTGLQNSLTAAFSLGGGAAIEGKLISCTFDSLANADAGMRARHVFDCDMRGNYADTSGNAFYTDGVPQIFARNRIQRGFATSADFGEPHCDAYQQVVGGSVLDQLLFVGNYYYGTHQAGYQGLFLSDDTGVGGYKNCIAIGNIFTGTNVNQIRFGSNGSNNGFNTAFGNTVVNPFADGAASTNIGFSTNVGRPSYKGYNVVTGLATESTGLGVENNTLVTTGNYLTKMPNYANLKLATSAAALLTAAYTADSAGADWARQFIDWTTTDPTQVIRWSLLPALIDYIAVTGSALSTVITTPIQKVKGYIPTATDLAVTPDAGVEWTTFSDELGTVTVRAWGTGTGVVRRGHTMQMRKTSPATATTAFTIGATINGYAVVAGYTTA